MSVLDREALEQSPLADLHAIASELSLDGYRRLRKADLIDAILASQGDGSDAPADDAKAAEAEPDEAEPDGAEPESDNDEERPARRRRGRRGGRGRSGASARADDGDSDGTDDGAASEPKAPDPEPEPQSEEVIEGEVELLQNGSAFVRVNPPEPSDDDVYISAAQVKRCELVSGDRISGPRRAPRRSERFASLVRIDAINGRPASEIAEGTRFDDLPAAFPTERFKLGLDDPTVKAIEWLTPFGKGSRVAIVGPARSGKTEALRRLAVALSGHDDVQLFVALSGVRPEEISEWNEGPTQPTVAHSFATSPDAQAHAVELVLDRARRAASRGGDAVVLVDTLDGMAPHAARKLTAAARNIVGGGSLTVIATAAAPLGGETTVITLDAALAAIGRFPSLDLVASGVLRPELLVGEAGAEAIARSREAAEED
ncbi:MAG TPA: Rho termination factor N-terminal domain-containing protein [Solirubrobacteraceae bacterium]|nr:Rho termination factor N-terminal domain-containing protein [Solirubrobacteraceae bacterium]